jgi:hypothetical protein
LPEDGWELIKVDLGRYADDVTPRLDISELGYIVLYNRYNGTMRFLGSLSKFSSSSKSIKFNIRLLRENEMSQTDSPFPLENQLVQKRPQYYDKSDLQVTNLLSLNNEYMQPLDQKTKTITTSVLAKFPGNKNNNYFFWFDVPLAYDLCVCKGKLMLALSYEEIDEWDLKAEGTLLANYTASSGADISCNSQIPNQVIGGLIATANLAVSPSSFFSNVGGFTGLLKAGACALGMTPKDQKTLSVFTDVVEGTSTLIESTSKVKNSSPKKTDNLKDFYIDGTDTVKKSDILGVLSKSTKFLTSAYNSTTLNQAKSVKKAGGLQNNIQGVVTLNGTITNKIYNWRDALIAVPGSSWGNNVLKEESYTDLNNEILPEYPIYNEALGTLAFLKTPEVDAVQSNILFPGSAAEAQVIKALEASFVNPDNFINVMQYYENNPSCCSGFKNVDLNSFRRITIRLKDNLKYFFNPKTHVNIQKTGILAGFQYYVDKDNIQNSELVDLDDLKELLYSFIPYSNGKLFLKIAVNFNSFDLNSKGTVNSNIQLFTVPIKNNILVTNNFYLFENGIYTLEPNFDSDGNFINYTQNGIINNFSTEQIREMIGIHLPNIVTLSSTNPFVSINGSTINASSPKDVLIYSEQPIHITNSFFASNSSVQPYKVVVRSKQYIKVESQSEFMDKVQLEIGDNLFIGKWPQPPVDISFVQSFCDKQSPEGIIYEADEFDNNKTGNSNNNIKNEIHSIENITISPNPANNILNIRKDEQVVICSTSIIDMLGKKILTKKGDIKTIDISSVQSGFYIVQVTLANGKTQSSKLRIQK